LAALALFLAVLVVIIRFRLQLSSRNSILFFGPSPEIDKLAAIRAERSMWIILPFTLTMAGRTLDPKGHSRSV
jgi:hypothetical protein